MRISPAFWNGFLGTGILIGILIAICGAHRNGLFEFCTTRAYGWPYPWKIDYCLCGKGATVYPIESLPINLVFAAFCSSIGGGFRWAWVTRRPYRFRSSN